MRGSEDPIEVERGAHDGSARDLLVGQSDILSRFDRQYRHVYVSENVEASTGLPPSAFLGKTNRELGMPADLVRRWETAFEQVFTTGRELDLHFDYPAPDGQRFFVGRLRPERAPDGSIPTVICAVRDVTEAQRALLRLREEDLRNQGLFRLSQEIIGQLPEAIVVLDLHGNVQQWLGSAAQITGYGAAEVVGEPLAFALGVEGSGRVQKLLEEVAATGHFLGEIPCRRRDGSQVAMEVNARAVRQRDGKAVQVVVIGRDIRDRKQAEERAQQLIEERAARAQAVLAQERLAFLARASDDLASSLDPAFILQRSAELAVPGLADWCFVDLFERDGGFNRLGVAPLDAPGAPVRRRYGPPPESSPVGQVLRSTEPTLGGALDDAAAAALASDDRHRAFLRELGVRAWTRIPLIARGQHLGAISLVSTRDADRYQGEALALARALAARAATAVDNAQLYAAAESARKRATDLQEITATLAGAQSPEQVCRIVLAKALRLLDLEVGAVGLIGDDGTTLGVLSSAGAALGEEVEREWQRVPLDFRSPATDAAREGVLNWFPTRAASLERYPHLGPLQEKLGSHAWGGIPMVSDGRRTGVLGFASREPRELSGDERGFLLAVATQCAQAFHRARLYQAERKLEERYRSLVEASAQIVWTNSADGEMLGEQPGWGAFTGQAPGEYQRFGWAEALHPEDRARTLECWREAVSSCSVFLCEHRVRRRDGVYRDFSAHAVPVREPDGKVREWVGVHTDITDRKRRDRELRESEERAQQLYLEAIDADRLKDEFLAMLGHELRNPLAPITTALHLMKLRGAGNERERAVIERQAQHLGRLVDDLLDVSRITRGKIELRKEPIELSSAIVRAVEITKPLLEQRRHAIALDVPIAGLRVEGDLVRLAQVIANLLNNAAKYTPAGGQIRVAAAPEAGEAVLRVLDNGQGMSPQLLKHAFDLFVQGDRGLDRAQGGLGIGLTLVRRLVGLHGGTVEARSEGPGLGSELIVRLPLVQPLDRAAPEETPDGIAGAEAAAPPGSH